MEFDGLGLCGTATLIMAVLKLNGTISWSWWIVCAPLGTLIGLYVLCALIVLIGDLTS